MMPRLPTDPPTGLGAVADEIRDEFPRTRTNPPPEPAAPDRGEEWLAMIKRLEPDSLHLEEWAALARQLASRVERLRGRLAELEWAGVVADWSTSSTYAVCPVCEDDQLTGHHDPDCWLRQELDRD